MGLPVNNSGFEASDVSIYPGGYLATGAGSDLTFGSWVFEQTAVNYADTFNDFSDTQGDYDWYYGWSTNPDDVSAFIVDHMIYSSGVWISDGTLGTADDTPWLSNLGQYPPATESQSYAVRRWISDITATVWIVGYSQDETGDSLDGLIFTIRLNGTVLYERTVTAGDYSPEKFALQVAVVAGDKIDFVVDTGPNNIPSPTNYGGDFYQFRASIFSGSQSGIVKAGTAWAPISLVGQAAMIQGTGRFYQDLTGPHSSIKIKFRALATAAFTLQLLLNGEVVDELEITDPTFENYTSESFDFPFGTNRLAFQGLGADDQELYIDDVSIVGAFYLDGIETSDSGETPPDPNRGRTEYDSFVDFEEECSRISYARSLSETSESIENKNLGVLNPYEIPVSPNDGSLGNNHGINAGTSYDSAVSELSVSRESQKTYKNGLLLENFACRLPYESLILGDSPRVLYRMDDESGSVLADRVSSSNNGTYSGSYSFNEKGAILGETNTSVRFTGGSATSVDTPVRFGSGPFSLELWFKVDTLPSIYQGLLSKRVSGEYIGWALYISATNHIAWEVSSNGAAFFDLDAGLIAEKTWYHVVVTIDRVSNTETIYLNGALIQSNSIVGLGNTDKNVAMLIGDSYEHPFVGPFAGWVDEVAVYDYALTADQVSLHYLGARPNQS